MNAIALIGDFSPSFEPHVATAAAIAHSGSALGMDVRGEWIATERIGKDLFERFAGIWIAPGSPYRDMQKVLWAIQHARERDVPCLGTCGGFQHMILEYARSVLGFSDAQHAEYEPMASRLFVSKLECSLAGREMQLRFVAGSKAAGIYSGLSAVERYYCNFGVNPEQVAVLKEGPLVVSGSDAEGEVRVIELPEHPFFMGTLYVPQARSTPGAPHPLVNALVRAVVDAR
jgi:CTP synthase (UTP-ammonia lyase)